MSNLLTHEERLRMLQESQRLLKRAEDNVDAYCYDAARSLAEIAGVYAHLAEEI